MKNLLVVAGIPAYNEEKTIAKIIINLQKLVDKIIVCDDGSSDATAAISESLGAIVVKHDRNLGYGAAIRSLFLKSREINADILVTLDGDGQHMTEDVSNMLEPIYNDVTDIVVGSRFLGQSQNMPAYRKVGIKVLTKLANTSLENKITDSQSGFRAYNKKAVAEITMSDRGMGISNEILMNADKKGFRIKEIPITIIYEGNTSTHNPVSHGANVALSTMKFISIEHPLKFYGIPGLIALGIGLFFIVWTLQIFSESREVITNISLIGIGFTIFGIILIMNSIMLFSIINVIRESKS